jgi:hypothetical protein
MFEALGLSAVNQGLLWGSLLVASPIIIHLLSKRKFRVVDWAAMDFLLEANRRNRRRIQLENLILLILRCLAIILLTFLVARLLVNPSSLLGGGAASYRTERIIVLDDSPSMGARGARKTCFDEAKEGLSLFVRNLAQERPGDTVTLLTTSDPTRPLVHGQLATPDKAEEWVRIIERLELADLPASFDQSLLEIERSLESKTGNVNRMVWVVTDLRQRDWLPAAAQGQESPLVKTIKRLRPKLSGMAVVDLGTNRYANVSVANVAPVDKSLVAGVPTRFEVTLRNFGDADSSEVEVAFTGGDAAPLKASVPSVKAGSTAHVPFTFTFRDTGAATVTAEIGADDLPADNARYYAANVQEGVQVLVVDGEPSSEYGQSETFFVERALAPPGALRSGNALQVVTENQFEGMALDQFQAIIVCNLYRLSDDRIAALEGFVRGGGGLVFFLGDQIDEASYNGRLYHDGQGLFPVKLAGIDGDESERTWVNLTPRSLNHPVLRVYQGANNPFLGRVKIFRWWSSAAAEATSTVLASMTNSRGDPLIVEKSLGKGKTLAVMTAGDDEWSTWPADPSFVVCALEMVSHTARPTTGDRQLSLGATLQHSLNVGRYEGLVTVTPPTKEKATQIRGVASEDAKGLVVQYDETKQRGFYRISASRRDGKEEQIVYAANIDPDEGDLRHADSSELRRRLGDTSVDLVSGMGQFRAGEAGGQGEIWRTLLIALAATLIVEQFLGWRFGQRR